MKQKTRNASLHTMTYATKQKTFLFGKSSGNLERPTNW